MASPENLQVFRKRLLGEVIGDADLVADTLSPDFRLVMHAGGARSVLSAGEIVESVRRQGEAGGVMWLDLCDLLRDEETVAAQGSLVVLASGTKCPVLTTTPLCFFIRFGTDHRMVSEEAFMDTSAGLVQEEAGTLVPSSEHLRAHIG